MEHGVRVSTKLPAMVVGIALLCTAGVGLASYFSGANSVKALAEERLLALAESRKDLLVDFMQGIESGITVQEGQVS